MPGYFTLDPVHLTVAQRWIVTKLQSEHGWRPLWMELRKGPYYVAVLEKDGGRVRVNNRGDCFALMKGGKAA